MINLSGINLHPAVGVYKPLRSYTMKNNRASGFFIAISCARKSSFLCAIMTEETKLRPLYGVQSDLGRLLYICLTSFTICTTCNDPRKRHPRRNTLHVPPEPLPIT